MRIKNRISSKYIQRISVFICLLCVCFSLSAQQSSYKKTTSSYDTPIRQSNPTWGLKTNFLYWATLTPNLTVEAALAKKWTFELTGAYNPFSFSDGTSLKHFLIMPELRYWLCQSFEGHFFGLHGGYAYYDKIGNIDFIPKFDGYLYKGYAYGGGISYGYHFPLGGRWGLELTVGAGYARLVSDKYQCADCKEYLGRTKRDYWGPTKAGISIIFMIN